MVFWRLVISLIMLISIWLEQSNARSVHYFVNLAQPPYSPSKLDNQVAPSPSSIAAATTNSGINQAPASQPTMAFDSCDGVHRKCQDDHISMTACIFPAKKGHEESILLVHNNGENPLMLKVNISPANKTYDNIQIPRHDVKQINISSKIGANSSIILDAGTGKCTIDMGRSVWQGYFNLPYSYTTYVTPMNGAYLLGVTALLIGGIFICCKLRKQDRHLEGVAYQELEMGKPELQSSIKLETNAEGWNESWDDDWDEEEAVNPPPPGGKNISRKLANGFDDLDKS